MDDKNKIFTPCDSLILISLLLWAEPIIKKFFLNENERWFLSLLKEGMYAPSKFNLAASFMLFDKINLYLFFFKKFLSFKIVLKLFLEL